MTRKTFITFVLAFLLNLIWEHLHSVLYVSYRGEAITTIILFRAALFDAVVITLFYFFFSQLPEHLHKTWFLPLVLTVFAVGLEEWALATGRWVYTGAMPIIPLLGVGLTPTIQLGLLGYISIRISERFRN